MSYFKLLILLFSLAFSFMTFASFDDDGYGDTPDSDSYSCDYGEDSFQCGDQINNVEGCSTGEVSSEVCGQGCDEAVRGGCDCCFNGCLCEDCEVCSIIHC